ncbi:putative serine peptidase [Podospora aff. communis PSN243]|uniref:Serine peptidase n=1 Tax=Podospora aff. communis PSN243 TaxID=3040156 RepID=A0AAV9G444_9PEZI|nr:putative serine peptidase [Podospora aff. communis PSN243]
MRKSGVSQLFFSCLALLQSGAEAFLPKPPLPPPFRMLVVGPNGGNGSFEQYVDHANPSLGTFSQKYWWNTTYWAGPGSPIVFFTPGETEAAPYMGWFTNRTLLGQYAQAFGGAMIMLEHRYYGDSSPYSVLDTQNLTHLTLDNSIKDLGHFTRTVKLPFDESEASNSQNAPWIFLGGSYAGNLVAWTQKLDPDAFWAYHSSSAPVEAIYNFWQYFIPIQRGMPQNCSKDLLLISEHLDNVIESKNETAIHELKDMFGLADVEYHDDFAVAVGGIPAKWQGIQRYTNYSEFYQMCDSIQGVRPVNMGAAAEHSNSSTIGEKQPSTVNEGVHWSNVSADGVGLEKALKNFALWYKHEELPGLCKQYEYDDDPDWNDTLSTGCYDTHNATNAAMIDYRVDNPVNRQWFWMLCNEPFGYWMLNPPRGQERSYVPFSVGEHYYQVQCDIYFPQQGNYTHGSAAGKTVDLVNALTEGWNLKNTTRLLWVNGEHDPWRSASVSSEIRPGGPMPSTPEAPVFVLPEAIHCNELLMRNADANEAIRTAQIEMIGIMKKWLADWPSKQASAVA